MDSPMNRWIIGPDLPDIWSQQGGNPRRSRPETDGGGGGGILQPTIPNPPQHVAPISQDEPAGISLRGTDMKDFPKPIPQQLKERFFDIKVLYTQPLRDFITKWRRDPGTILMKPRYLGLDSQNTKLHIVIQCEKRVAKKIKKFFAQRHVEEELLPDFRVLVVDEPPTEVANEDAIEVLSDSHPIKTMCGMPVTLKRGDKSVSCTLGGVIVVETDQKRRYGLIAGHPLKKFRGDPSGKQPTYESYGPSSSEEEENKDEKKEDSDDASATLSKPAHSDIERTNDDSILRTKLHVGTVAYDSFSIPSDENYDWALIDLNQEYALSNVVIRNEQPADTNSKYYEEIHRYYSNLLDTALTTQVLVLKQDKPRTAELSFNTSSLMMFPGSEFVDAHDVTMKDGSSFCPGDSGLWIVDAKSLGLYGHIVSVDAFGEAQVIPIQSTLQSIKWQLKATRVSLATDLAVEELSVAGREPSSSTIPGPTGRSSDVSSGITKTTKPSKDRTQGLSMFGPSKADDLDVKIWH
ncbi:hypothetical protein NXS19_002092 [Fusarium pseudograminearum]|nr:hypothetical protein NXS19_002092 [Fusarium pseudograminearum]